MKKILLGALLLGFLFSFSYGAVLSLSPSEGKIPENCVKAFRVDLSMDGGDEAITADLVVSSNMEFDRFENSDMFKYVTPARINGDNVSILLFNEPGGEITEGGIVGTLYYRTSGVLDPYVSFVFNGKGDTTDTNVNIEGRDILDDVVSGEYVISSDIICEEPIVERVSISGEDEMEKFIEQFQEDHKWERTSLFLQRNKWYILGIAGLLIIIIVLVSYKAQKKG